MVNVRNVPGGDGFQESQLRLVEFRVAWDFADGRRAVFPVFFSIAFASFLRGGPVQTRRLGRGLCGLDPARFGFRDGCGRDAVEIRHPRFAGELGIAAGRPEFGSAVFVEVRPDGLVRLDDLVSAAGEILHADGIVVVDAPLSCPVQRISPCFQSIQLENELTLLAAGVSGSGKIAVSRIEFAAAHRPVFRNDIEADPGLLAQPGESVGPADRREGEQLKRLRHLVDELLQVLIQRGISRGPVDLVEFCSCARDLARSGSAAECDPRVKDGFPHGKLFLVEYSSRIEGRPLLLQLRQCAVLEIVDVEYTDAVLAEIPVTSERTGQPEIQFHQELFLRLTRRRAEIGVSVPRQILAEPVAVGKAFPGDQVRVAGVLLQERQRIRIAQIAICHRPVSLRERVDQRLLFGRKLPQQRVRDLRPRVGMRRGQADADKQDRC